MLELRKITQAIGRAVMGSDWVVPEIGERADLQLETDTVPKPLPMTVYLC